MPVERNGIPSRAQWTTYLIKSSVDINPPKLACAYRDGVGRFLYRARKEHARKEAHERSPQGDPLNECVGAISLIEVTQRSLESKEIASAEQEVLGRALKATWFVHDWIYERTPDEPDDEDADAGDEP